MCLYMSRADVAKRRHMATCVRVCAFARVCACVHEND